MLFNSWIFLLGFLPVTLAGFFLLGRRSPFMSAAWLAGASLFFYGWWDLRYVPLLLASICFNYGCSTWLASGPAWRRKAVLTAAVCANLALLGYYKYAGFLVASVAHLLAQPLPVLQVILPVGISFFTFTQIAFLVDTYRGQVRERRFVHYLLFVTYFPHLIAGPVLHHKEMMPQFADRKVFRLSAENMAVGASIFLIGLAKKVLLADNLAPFAGALFNQPGEPSLLIAWSGVLAYAFQLYFDFSGYSDMAIGLSRLFGVKLPLNFDSPYKAANIAQFWRRWHMTLSRFLRDYLYIPLGGNRHGGARRYLNLMITMVLGGLWHGAGWNFLIWGFLHGVFLGIHGAWSSLRLSSQSTAWKIFATALTFVAVCTAWVFFRAPDLASALAILGGLYGGNGLALPDALARHLAPVQPLLVAMNVSFYLGGGAAFIDSWGWIGLAALLAFGCPNTQQIMRLVEPALDAKPASSRMAWRPTRYWAAAMAGLALASMLSLNRPAEFLYFQF
ncbi:MBOAT family protein [Janthinobacterium sp. PC23-8]|uniref:MBOAT family O-acyltransferase n=1 Tax=Janthinobacterium sp. PC23-8 TaxID=2012679 RepID=UPI000B96ED5B|nr:MBOAT family protein [Janthinobacterium sp. PC23-8]OYO27858.1 membrane-bound O-acyltransferase family protein [Janthinobacterium sp. PC23-8]